MNPPCQLPCPPTPAQTDPCPPPCAVVAPDPCPAQDTPSCPQETFQVDPCPCQGAGVCPQIGTATCGFTRPTASPAELCTPGTCVETSPGKLPTPAMEPCTIETPGMCVMTFPLQKNILTVELCPSDADTFPFPPDELGTAKTAETCSENISPQLPVEPCTLEVLEISPEEPCCAHGVVLGDPRPDPCASQSAVFTEPRGSQSVPDPSAQGTCPSQGTQGLGDTGTAKEGRSCSSFRLNSRTSGVVERCLSRCQNWFRGKKAEK